MQSLFRLALILSVTFAVCGPVRADAQQIAPPGTGVTINKMVIDNGPIRTVKYTVNGGSPRLQALVRRVEWTENELSVVDQLQLLKLDTIVNERQQTAYRTAQLANPFAPPGFSPLTIGVNARYSETSLQSALTCQLAYEATPQSALQLIGYLEKMQTDLDAELKALPPQEKKAAQGAIDDLLPRLAALPRAEVPAMQRQPVATPAGAKPAIEVQWGNTWYPAQVLQVNGGTSLIHYAGWASSWDEWVPAARIRQA